MIVCSKASSELWLSNSVEKSLKMSHCFCKHAIIRKGTFGEYLRGLPAGVAQNYETFWIVFYTLWRSCKMQLCHNIIYSPGDGRPGNQCCFGYYCYYPFVYMAFFAMCYDPLIQFPSKRTLWLIPRLLHAGDDAQWEIKSSISPKDHLESPLLTTPFLVATDFY